MEKQLGIPVRGSSTPLQTQVFLGGSIFSENFRHSLLEIKVKPTMGLGWNIEDLWATERT
jgi:hypothetical protein